METSSSHARAPLTSLPADYADRVYAGVLGKVIGVYLGRPFENWTNDAIESSLGEIEYYVHDEVSAILRERRSNPDIAMPLIVTDDDISGTFTFPRALEDNGYDLDLSSKAIGRSWLNYLIEGRSVLWWGGMGNSTEHTAYLRLKQGIDAPQSGAIATNGQVVAEQIGGQIFIDGWAMLFPGDPERAADFAQRAASVSHDGAGVEGAQVVAAMEALAFVESDIDTLLDEALTHITADGTIRHLIDDVREWHAADPDDWRATFSQIQRRYGYDTYGGNCHMVPNHGLIVMALLHSGGDFTRGQTIVNTAGWDTDCNAGNLGCLLGVLTGIDGIDGGGTSGEAPDWRGPVADRLYLPTADGGRAISDVARETDAIVTAARRLRGDDAAPPKAGARFHFSYPGSVQGFTPCVPPPASGGAGNGLSDRVHTEVRNVEVTVDRPPRRVLRLSSTTGHASARTATFVESRATARYFEKAGYALMASPTLAAGQTVRASVSVPAAAARAEIAVAVWTYDRDDELTPTVGPRTTVDPGSVAQLELEVPDSEGRPVAFVGIDAVASQPAPPQQEEGVSVVVDLDHLTWGGVPNVILSRRAGGSMWHRAWVNGVDTFWPGVGESFRLVHNSGTGLLLHGCREWDDYRVEADVTPHLASSCGLAARVQGMRRHYSLVLVPGTGVELRATVDDAPEKLAESAADVALGSTWHLTVQVDGSSIVATATGPDGTQHRLTADDDRLANGAIALSCEEGRSATEQVTLVPLLR